MTQGQTSKKTYKILISQNSIEVIILGVARGAQGVWLPPPQLKCHQRQKCDKKVLFLYFQFLLASPHTTVYAYLINNNIDNQEARAPSIRFCQLIEMFNPSEIKEFFPKNCYLRPSSHLFINVMQ